MNFDRAGNDAREYLGPVLEATPRLLGSLDREPLSPTWGSFDRDHWAWKFRDFPINMLQAGVLPLAWLWRTPVSGNPWAANGQVFRWIEAALEVVLRRQRRNGAFDTVGPNTQDHGVTLAQCYILLAARRLLGDDCPAGLADRIAEAVRRGLGFAARSTEDYAFINNHQALFALTWLRAGEQLGEAAYRDRADEVLAGILRRQSPDGWYAEYGGADPGYESLGLQHLAEFERERPGTELSRSIDRALEFLAHCVQPDGSIGGGYGSRHTVQWYPAGFELLAARSPVAASIAGFIRPRLPQAPVVTPQTVDTHNLPLLMYSYCLAAAALGSARNSAAASPLPCQRELPPKHYPDAGLVVTSTPAYHAICGLKKGGVITVVSRQTGALAYEDAGYVVEAGRRGGRRWSSAFQGLTESSTLTGLVATTRARFGLAERPVLTPSKFVLLRVLNLTVFRSRVLGAIIRRMIIAQLISGRRPGRLVLDRQVTFGDDEVTIRDTLGGGSPDVGTVWRPRAFTAIHMGSARYAHPRDLAELPEPRLEGAARALAGGGSATLSTTIRFVDGDSSLAFTD